MGTDLGALDFPQRGGVGISKSKLIGQLQIDDKIQGL